MSYGQFWGTNWGGCDPGFPPPIIGSENFAVASATANSSKTFIVQFTVRPLAASPIGPNDVLNLGNATLTNCDTLETVSIMTAGVTVDSVSCIEFALFGEWESALVKYEICFENLVGYFDEAFVDPMCATFLGMPNVQLPREQVRPLLDYHNPQTSGDLINGGLVIGTNADYEFEGGVQLLNKLIIRRIITAQDEFFHLSDRQYGLGVQAKLTYTASDLVGFKRQLEAEVRKEPEIDQVKVSLSLTADHILNITVRAILLTTGQQITVSLPLDLTSVPSF